MKSLVHAINSYLTLSEWTDAYAVRDVYLAVSADLIPMEVGFPAVGIKDGPIVYEYPDAGGCRRILRVDLIVCQEITAGDEAVTGTLAALADGVLAITDHLRAALTDNFLDIAGMESALPVEETEAELAGTDFLCLRKRLTMEYTHWEDR